MTSDVLSQAVLGFSINTDLWVNLDVVQSLVSSVAGLPMQVRFMLAFQRLGENRAPPLKNRPSPNLLHWLTALPEYIGHSRVYGGVELLSVEPCIVTHKDVFPPWFVEMTIVLASLVGAAGDRSRDSIAMVDLCTQVDLVFAVGLSGILQPGDTEVRYERVPGAYVDANQDKKKQLVYEALYHTWKRIAEQSTEINLKNRISLLSAIVTEDPPEPLDPTYLVLALVEACLGDGQTIHGTPLGPCMHQYTRVRASEFVLHPWTSGVDSC
jgi:hypothetical protein